MTAREELLAALRLHAQPIDFAQLEASGVLRWLTDRWWQVLDMARLPRHVALQAEAVKSVQRQGQPPRVFVQLPVSWQAARLLLRQFEEGADHGGGHFGEWSFTARG